MPSALRKKLCQSVFNRGQKFGFLAGAGVVLAYFLRVFIPYRAIFQSGSIRHFILYTGVFVFFFYVPLYHTGCPNCTNDQCPLSPDFSLGWATLRCFT